MRYALVHRRQAWSLTPLGWLVAFVICVGALLATGRWIHPFLAISAPSGGRLLVVEGWIGPDELNDVVQLVRQGHYKRVVTTGGPVPVWLEQFAYISHAELARDYLVRQGLTTAQVHAAPAPRSAQDRTYLSAVIAREWLEASGNAVDRFDLVSVGVHCRRSWMLFRAAFGSDVRVGIVALRPSTYDPEKWWATSAGVKTVIPEAFAWLWAAIFFRAPERGSPAEKWSHAEPDSSMAVELLYGEKSWRTVKGSGFVSRTGGQP